LQSFQEKMKNQIQSRRIVLCICGMAGSGKSTVARRLAEKYGFKRYSGGEALKALASEMGYNVGDRGWWESQEGIKFLRERMDNPEFDRKIDMKLMEWAKHGNVILDSWTMPWLLKDGFKVWLEACEEVRSRRVAKRDRISLKEALDSLREKESKTRLIYKKLYGFDLGEDFTPFDLILDVNLLSSDEVFRVLSMVVENLLLRKEG